MLHPKIRLCLFSWPDFVGRARLLLLVEQEEREGTLWTKERTPLDAVLSLPRIIRLFCLPIRRESQFHDVINPCGRALGVSSARVPDILLDVCFTSVDSAVDEELR